MRDPGTRHQFDVRRERVESATADGMEVVEGYPVHVGPNARPGKPYQELRAEARRQAEVFGSPLPAEFADEPRPTDTKLAAEPARSRKRSES